MYSHTWQTLDNNQQHVEHSLSIFGFSFTLVLVAAMIASHALKNKV